MKHDNLLQKILVLIKFNFGRVHRRLFWIFIPTHVFPEQSIIHSLIDYLPWRKTRKSTAIKNVRVLAPAEKVTIGSPENDPFIPVGKYYRSGTFVRPTIFVCDVPDARLQVGTGMVCTRDWEVVTDLKHRYAGIPPFRRPSSSELQRRSGKCSTVFFVNAGNIGHWWMDCLPRIHSLAKAEPTAELTLLMPEMGPVHRESLECVLPQNFRIEYFPYNTWLSVDDFLWPSMVSGRCNFMLPAEYYDSIRRPVFAKFGLPTHHQQTARIYISRRGARHRRILNEEQICRLLTQYGFDIVSLEKYSFREQVELFHRADIVIGAHGAGWTSILFSGRIRSVIFYSTRTPQNHYHTMSKGLGQEFYFLTDDRGEEDDFSVNLKELEKLLKTRFGLKPGAE